MTAQAQNNTAPQVENELKYVLRLDFNAQALHGWEKIQIKQAYPKPKPYPRYRQEMFEDSTLSYTTNIKTWSNAHDAQLEDENDTNEASFKEAWNSAKEKKKLTKTRYKRIFGDEEWVIDFFHDKKEGTYFVMAEVEMPKGRKTPITTPLILANSRIYAVPKTDRRFSSRKLANPKHAEKMLQKLGHQQQLAPPQKTAYHPIRPYNYCSNKPPLTITSNLFNYINFI